MEQRESTHQGLRKKLDWERKDTVPKKRQRHSFQAKFDNLAMARILRQWLSKGSNSKPVSQ